MESNITPDQIRSIFKLSFQDPTLGERKLEQRLGIGHTTIGKYKRLAKKLNYTAEYIMQMDDLSIIELFKLKSRKVDFIEPNWDEIRKYLQEKGHWGQMLPTIKSAWEYIYLKKLFPNYVTGDLPDGVMSERTFCRRYDEYLHSKGLDLLKHKANPNNNFGPGSVVEIDTIGDRLKYLDADNNEHEAVIFTAVLKYSRLLYAEAMPSGTGICWAGAIINALYSFGGVPEVLRCDNDSALVIHGNKSKRTKLRASIEFTINEFGLITDLCPPRRPEYKGSNERANGFALKHFFEGTSYGKEIHADNLDALNELIKKETLRINSLPRNHGQLSSIEVFNSFEKNALKALPLIRPDVRYISYAVVHKDGYVNYQRNYYYAGKDNVGKTILIENMRGKQIVLRHEKTLRSIVEYELDRNCIPPGNHHKADKFKTESEKVTSRTKEWFISEFSKIEKATDNIQQLINWVFEITSRSNQVGTKICNSIYKLCTDNLNDLDCLELACKAVLERKHKVDIVVQLSCSFDMFRKLKNEKSKLYTALVQSALGVDTKAQDQTQDKSDISTSDSEDSVRGEEYYDDLFKSI